MSNSNLKVQIGLIFLSLFFTSIAQAQVCDQQDKLLASPPQSVEFLGAANGVDIHENYAIAGGQGNNSNGSLAGAAHFFKKNGSEWEHTQMVVPNDISANDRFGKSVAIWGDYAIVGSPFDDINGFFSGSAFVYHRIGDNWIQELKITPEDGGSSDRFGWSVDIWQDYIIVGSLNDYTDALASTGSAYIFKRDGEDWNQISKLYPEDGGNFDEFGSSISIKDNLAIVGSHFHDEAGSNSGAAYLYANQDTAWVLQEKLVASDGSAIAEFGNSVSVSDGLATISAHQDVFNNDTTGAVYVFRQNAELWEEEAKIITPETTFNMAFGISNDHLGNRIAIGTTVANTVGVSQSGAVFIFDYNGTDWEYERKITAFDPENLDFFGVSLAMDGDNIIIGAPGEDSNGGGDAGAAYVHYTKCEPTCTTISSPVDGSSNVSLDSDISWYPVEGASGYFLSVGTSSGAVDIIDNMDMGDVLTFDLAADFLIDTDYFVNIIAYNDSGNSSGCFESEFTTSIVAMTLTVGSDVDVPCFEPVPVEDYIVNNACGPVTAEVTTVTTDGDCPAEYTLERTYTVTDGCTTISDVQIVNIVDNDPPNVLSVPANVTIACGDNLPTELATGEDQCSATPVTVTFEDSPSPSCGLVVVRTFSLIDECGNVATATQIITIESDDGLPSCAFMDSPVGEDNPLDVTLNWTAATETTGYVISVGLVSDGSLIVDSLDVMDVLTYELNGLLPGTEYFVTITPYNAIGSAAFCEEYFFSTTALPSCVLVTGPINDMPVWPIGAQLEWSSDADAAGYVLSVGTTPGGTDLIDNLDVMNVLTYNLPDLLDLTTYYVNVTPYNEIGSAEACAEYMFDTDLYIGISENDYSNLISIYPNPSAGDFIMISLPADLQSLSKLSFTIYNSLGSAIQQNVLTEKDGNSVLVKFDTPLSSGVYHIVLQSEKGPIVKSIVVN